MTDLGPIPELDYDAARRQVPDYLHSSLLDAVDDAAADLDAYAHAARERIEQLEGEVAELHQVAAFLRSCVLSGEQIHGEYAKWVDDTLKGGRADAN